jgi:hypothetical protein
MLEGREPLPIFVTLQPCKLAEYQTTLPAVGAEFRDRKEGDDGERDVARALAALGFELEVKRSAYSAACEVACRRSGRPPGFDYAVP